MDFAITIDHASERPLYRQLYDELRRAILTGRLKLGARVPSTRTLAATLGVSRTTVKQSYELLISEGYLESVIGSGTSVCAQLPDELLRAQPAKTATLMARAAKASPRLSRLGQSLTEVLDDPVFPNVAINFSYGHPAVDHFPQAQWRQLLLRELRRTDTTLFDYAQDGRGYEPLRVALATYLSRSRAVRCDADQLIIVNGSQQALTLIAQVLLDRGDVVALENPGYLGARQVCLQYGARLHPAPVDGGGIIVGALPRRGVKFAYVTPSHQFPTGAVLPLARRLELLRWAEKAGALIVEDDYDSEFRYGSYPIPALQGLDPNEAVIYVGTFSKVMFPALRLGYLVVPRSLLKVIERAKWLSDRHTPTLEQRALTSFLNDGLFESHLRKMRKLYDQRRQTLARVLLKHFGDRVTILGENSGLHVMIRLQSRYGDHEVMERAAAVGVGLISADLYYLGPSPGGEFVIGYGRSGERTIREGVRRLALALA